MSIFKYLEFIVDYVLFKNKMTQQKYVYLNVWYFISALMFQPVIL